VFAVEEPQPLSLLHNGEEEEEEDDDEVVVVSLLGVAK